MKLIRILRMARGLTLMDLQHTTKINAGTLSLFENGKLELNEEQKDKLHALFPKHDKEKLFTNVNFDDPRTHRSLFTSRKLTPEQDAFLDAEVKKSIQRIEAKAQKEKERLQECAKKAVEQLNKRGF